MFVLFSYYLFPHPLAARAKHPGIYFLSLYMSLLWTLIDWNCILCSLCDWLLSLNIMFLRFSHVVRWNSTLFFYDLIGFCYIDRSYFVYFYPLMNIWVISTLGYSKPCCHEHGCANNALRSCFQFLWI